jgi:hypothetical protein
MSAPRLPKPGRIAVCAALLWGAAVCAIAGGVAGGPEHEGVPVDCDIPMSLRVKNTGGSDGAGLCVFASLEMAARYQNCTALIGTFDWMRTQPGGGWPERVDRIMKDRAPSVKYKQYSGRDLEFIQDGINSGRPVCVTYGYGEFYGNSTIAHMVLCVKMDSKWTGILDNNDPDHIWWMETPEFHKRFVYPNGNGWAFYTLEPVPPPVPHLNGD